MDGKSLQSYWTQEINSLIAKYDQFATLISSKEDEGSSHRGEDGRFIEELIRECLSKFLPQSLEVLTGFILRPAVKTGKSGRERNKDKDDHSTQLDIIVYDSERYPVFQRFGNSVIVPPEGVVAVISIKKHLYDSDIKKECQALREVSKLCKTLSSNSQTDKVRGPFLALVSIDSKIVRKNMNDWVSNQIKEVYAEGDDMPTFDDLVGYIGSLKKWSLFKARPEDKTPSEAEYLFFAHDEEETHLGLQFILSGILSVFYDETRRNIRRPGFTSFPPLQKKCKSKQKIQYNGLA